MRRLGLKPHSKQSRQTNLGSQACRWPARRAIPRKLCPYPGPTPRYGTVRHPSLSATSRGGPGHSRMLWREPPAGKPAPGHRPSHSRPSLGPNTCPNAKSHMQTDAVSKTRHEDIHSAPCWRQWTCLSREKPLEPSNGDAASARRTTLCSCPNANAMENIPDHQQETA